MTLQQITDKTGISIKIVVLIACMVLYAAKIEGRINNAEKEIDRAITLLQKIDRKISRIEGALDIPTIKE